MKAAVTESVVKNVVVKASRQTAFRVFTADMGAWWPLQTHSVDCHNGGDVVVEPRVGGRVHERTPTGDEHTWGHITVWDEPSRVSFTWHPGREDGSVHTDVDVVFTTDGDTTVVTLTHSGWDRLDDGADVRPGYESGWDGVLAGFVARAEA